MVDRQQTVSVLLAIAVLASMTLIVVNAAEIASGERNSDPTNPYARFENATEDVTQIAEPRPNGTVFTAYRYGGILVAVHPNGTLRYFMNEHDEYYDVDPLDDDRVLVAAMYEYNKSACPAAHSCTLEQILIVDLDSGDTAVVHERYRKYTGNNEWHDVDKIGPNRYLIAGMEEERVYIINSSTGIVTWAWEPQAHYNISTGGSRTFGTKAWPYDWTHLNDVEMLPDGRIMVSMRNHDEVIFLNRSTGVEERWTIGEDDNTSTLFEQHNPDYISSTTGNPAVVIADSHNNRIIEYERRNQSWTATWVWTDAAMQWPRDADRLPNGHTLIADSNSGRLLEVDTNGDVVWSISGVPGNYDVERLNTGDESKTGQTASELQLEGTTTSIDSAEDAQQTNPEPRSPVRSVLPPILVNSVIYASPVWWTWFGIDGLLLFITGSCLIVVGIDKLSRLRIRSPFVRKK